MTKSSREAVDDATSLPQPQKPARRRGRRRIRRLLRRSIHSWQGILILALLVIGSGVAITAGGAAALRWTESAGFCGQCHTMSPELAAYATSPHHDVACGECHVEPGVEGWVKSKVAGTKQLFQLVTDSYPRPIPPPVHVDLPPVQETCLRCHPLDKITAADAPVTRVRRVHYDSDPANTPEQVYVLIAPSQVGPDPTIGGGVHWHVQQDVTFTTPDDRRSVIDLVDVRFKDGTTKEFVARSQVSISSDVTADVQRLRLIENSQRMDCLDCHNRIGHEIPSPGEAIDAAMTAGRINPSLPDIKRYGVQLVSGNYPSYTAADRAIAGLGELYVTSNPKLLVTHHQQISQAIMELQKLYRQVATPGMQVTATTYPSNLGHLSSTGCFRCHDGAHYRVVNGSLTNEVISFACTTCHTLPASGLRTDIASTVNKDGVPANHLIPGGILNQHGGLANSLGVSTCLYCHQPVYCATCHATTDLVAPTSP